MPRDQELPLSLTQEALWFLDRLEPHLSTYTSYPTMRIRGKLEMDSLQRALNEIERRHEALRTTFPEQDGRPIQVIGSPQARPVAVVDLTGFPEETREEEMRRWLREEMTRPIDLQKGPLVRITLLRTTASAVGLVPAGSTPGDGGGRSGHGVSGAEGPGPACLPGR